MSEDEKERPESALVPTDVRDGGNAEPESQTEITRTYVEEGAVPVPPTLHGPTGPTGATGPRGATGMSVSFTGGFWRDPRAPQTTPVDDVETLNEDDTNE